MKAQHVRKVRQRVRRAQETLMPGLGPGDYQGWVDRMAGLLDTVPGAVPTRRKERQAEAHALWMLLFTDVPGVCDALIEANQEAVHLRRQGLGRDMRSPNPEDDPGAAERYRAALIEIFREVCEPPWTVNGRKAWIRAVCQGALGVQCPQELPEQNAPVKAPGEGLGKTCE